APATPVSFFPASAISLPPREPNVQLNRGKAHAVRAMSRLPSADVCRPPQHARRRNSFAHERHCCERVTWDGPLIAYNNRKRAAPVGARSIHVVISASYLSPVAGQRMLGALAGGLAALLLFATADAEARPYRPGRQVAHKAQAEAADKKAKR